jgi:hypothetical protein
MQEEKEREDQLMPQTPSGIVSAAGADWWQLKTHETE